MIRTKKDVTVIVVIAIASAVFMYIGIKRQNSYIINTEQVKDVVGLRASHITQAMDSGTIGLIICDKDWTVRHVTSPIAVMFATSQASLVGKSLLEYMPPDVIALHAALGPNISSTPNRSVLCDIVDANGSGVEVLIHPFTSVVDGEEMLCAFIEATGVRSASPQQIQQAMDQIQQLRSNE